MEKITLNNVKIDFPTEIEASKISDVDVTEWIEYNLGLRGDIRRDNPLVDLDFYDCKISVGEFYANGKRIYL